MSFAHADGGCLHEFSVNLERRTRYSAVVYGWRLVQATAVVKMRLDNISGDSVYRLTFPPHPGMPTTYRGFWDECFKAEDWRLITRAPKIKLIERTRTLIQTQWSRRKKIARRGCARQLRSAL